MKKNLLLIMCLLIASTLFSQSLTVTPQAVIANTLTSSKNGNGNLSIMSIDTLQMYYTRAHDFKIYQNTAGGYVYGPAAYNNAGTLVPLTQATASHFSSVGNATVTQLLIWCAAKQIVGTADSISAVIYSVNADTSANVNLGSVNISTADLDTTGFFTVIPISANVTSAFLASINYAGIDDTFGLVSSDPDSSDGLGELRARQKLSAIFGGGWRSVDSLYGGSLNCDVMIIPIVNTTTGLNHFETTDYTLMPVTPSPANNEIHISYSLKNQSSVTYKIFDLSGKTIFKSDSKALQPGSYNETVDVSKFSAGNYYITFSANKNNITQKFAVVR